MLIGCDGIVEKPYVTENNDTISREFLVTDSRVGHLRRGMTASSLRKAYGDQYVKQLQMHRATSNDTVPHPSQYYVYDKENHLLFIAETSSKDFTSDEIDIVKIKDPRFRTTKDIGLKSPLKFPATSIKVSLADQPATPACITRQGLNLANSTLSICLF